jgi:hypothetical protein
MATARQPDPSLLVIACISRHLEALDWSKRRLQEEYGLISLFSNDFHFHHTTYYERQMGPGLRKRFLAFEKVVASDCLADVKNFTNRVEQELANLHLFPDIRPLNLDPGLLQLGKFLLATTKDQSHRIYLRDGIYAEVTLRFHDGSFEPWPWTYADYREPAYHEFFTQARAFFRAQLANQRQEGDKSQ